MTELSEKQKSTFKTLGLIAALPPMIFFTWLGFGVAGIEKEQKHFNKHKNDIVQVFKKNKSYTLLDTREIETKKYVFSVPENASDTLSLIKNDAIFGDIKKDNLILTKYNDRNKSFDTVTTAKNFSLSNSN